MNNSIHSLLALKECKKYKIKLWILTFGAILLKLRNTDLVRESLDLVACPSYFFAKRLYVCLLVLHNRDS